MAKMYVANGTRQVQDFNYRLPGDPQPYQVRIPIGMQVKLPNDLSQPEIDHIIKKNAKYGFVDADEAKRRKHYIGMIYALDKPVPSPKVEFVLMHNLDILRARGKENRKMAALTANKKLEEQLAAIPGLANLEGMEMEITQEVKPGEVVPDDAVAEDILVSKSVSREDNGVTTKTRKQPRRGRG